MGSSPICPAIFWRVIPDGSGGSLENCMYCERYGGRHLCSPQGRERSMFYSEKIEILSPLAAPDAEESIVKEIKELNAIREEMYALTEKKWELEKQFDARSKELMKMRGILFDFIQEESAPVEEPERDPVNILLLGLTPH